jgi:hypothetical protein
MIAHIAISSARALNAESAISANCFTRDSAAAGEVGACVGTGAAVGAPDVNDDGPGVNDGGPNADDLPEARTGPLLKSPPVWKHFLLVLGTRGVRNYFVALKQELVSWWSNPFRTTRFLCNFSRSVHQTVHISVFLILSFVCRVSVDWTTWRWGNSDSSGNEECITMESTEYTYIRERIQDGLSVQAMPGVFELRAESCIVDFISRFLGLSWDPRLHRVIASR